MATNNSNTEADSLTDLLLSEEDILAFFLSKSGEVKNSELVMHFRRALKSGQHRRTNRQKFPQFVNHLSTVRVNADGNKILTLKEEFRHREDAATAPEEAAVKVASGEASTVATAVATDDGSQHQFNDEQTTPQATDRETIRSKEHDMGEVDQNANRNNEHTTVEDVSSKTLGVTNDEDRKSESLAEVEQRTQHDDKSAASASSENVDKTQAATQETQTEDNIVNDGSGVASISATNTQKEEKAPTEGKLNDNGSVEPAKDGTVDSGSNVADSSEVQETERIPAVVIVVEDESSVGQSDEVDGTTEYQRVKELAQRIDEAANTPASMAPLRTTKQVPGKPPTSRPASTAYEFTMNEHQREWTLRASYSDYQALAKLLGRHQGLVSRRDFITGYSALHWAAKNGRADVVKLLMGNAEAPDVDAKSHGGYTSLHVAAMNSKHDVIELLVVVYKADTDATDFAGRKPIYYLPHDTARSPRSSAFCRRFDTQNRRLQCKNHKLNLLQFGHKSFFFAHKNLQPDDFGRLYDEPPAKCNKLSYMAFALKSSIMSVYDMAVFLQA